MKAGLKSYTIRTILHEGLSPYAMATTLSLRAYVVN